MLVLQLKHRKNLSDVGGPVASENLAQNFKNLRGLRFNDGFCWGQNPCIVFDAISHAFQRASMKSNKHPLFLSSSDV
jgi:hypothetical protein